MAHRPSVNTREFGDIAFHTALGPLEGEDNGRIHLWIGHLLYHQVHSGHGRLVLMDNAIPEAGNEETQAAEAAPSSAEGNRSGCRGIQAPLIYGLLICSPGASA